MLQKNYGLELEVILDYAELSNFERYCQNNNITVIQTRFEQTVHFIIETTFNEKEKIMYEIEKKTLNIQNMEIIKEKNIRKK